MRKLLEELGGNGSLDEAAPLEKKDPRLVEILRRLEIASDKLFIPTPMKNSVKEAIGDKWLSGIETAQSALRKSIEIMRKAYMTGKVQ